MTKANARAARKLFSIINTVEILIDDMEEISTPELEATMPANLVQAVKQQRDVVRSELTKFHAAMDAARQGSTDGEISPMSGGGGGK
jgi:hypothetical protein